jgi:hypothetical protein
LENNPTDRTSPDYDRLQKIRRVYNYLINKYSTLYNPREYLAGDEVIVEFKGRGGVLPVHPKEEKNIWNQDVQTFVIVRAIRMTWLLILVNNIQMLLKMSPLHMEQH